VDAVIVHIHGHRPFTTEGVDARNTPIDYSIPRVDVALLTNLHILGLRFPHLDFRFEFFFGSATRARFVPGVDVLAPLQRATAVGTPSMPARTCRASQ